MKALYVITKTFDLLICNYTISRKKDSSVYKMIFYVNSLTDFYMNLLLTSSVTIVHLVLRNKNFDRNYFGNYLLNRLFISQCINR